MGSLISLLLMSPSIQFTALTVISLTYILVTPFTKVEESFSMQAIHDFIYLGIPRAWNIVTKLTNGQAKLSFNPAFPLDLRASIEPINSIHPYNYSDLHWDHEEFPGPVPRTFIGPFIIGLLTFPWSLTPQGINQRLIVQLAARINLALLVLLSFYHFSKSVARRFGTYTQRALILLTLTQFHFLFYASRALPNTFALVLILFASSKWLSRKYSSFIILVAVTVVIFRFETCLLFAPMIFRQVFIEKDLTLTKLFLVGIPSGLLSLGTTVLFDSYMWQKWVWPEGYGFYFNVYLNKSQDWGTQPFLWYFYSALPRSLLFSIFFVPFATKRCIKTLLTVSLAFITIYSFLGHKELRFIIYCIPLLNTCAANTIAIMGSKFFSSKPYPESWLGNIILKRLGFQVASDADLELYEKETEERERQLELREAEKKKRSKDKSKSNLPSQYDAITKNPSSTLRRRGQANKSYKNGVEDVLDEQYSKITAAILDKNKEPSLSDNSSRNFDDPLPESTFFSTFIIILMAVHIWCNLGCLVYASVSSWHNYPGGDAVNWTNDHIRAIDLRNYKLHDIGIYVCNLAAQTGFTRFLQLNGITYDKSPEYHLMTNKTQRIAKWRNNIVDPKAQLEADFRVIYFILEGIDVNFLTKFCTSTMSKKVSTKTRFSSKITNTMENVVCKLGSDVQDCTLVKVVNGFDGIDFGRAPRSIVIRTVPKLWVLRCSTR